MKWIALTMASMVGVVTITCASEAWLESGRGTAPRVDHAAIHAHTRKVDLNGASNRELLQLPGFGPELAERVVRHRPYHKLDELVARKVLGRKEFARIKERIRITDTAKRKSTRQHPLD